MNTDRFSRQLTFLKVLGIAVMIFVILGSTVDVALHEYIKNFSSRNISADKTIETNSQNSRSCIHKGNVLFDLNKYDKAIKIYSKAIEINPQDSKAWCNKGITLYKLNKFDEAIETYDKAIEINPQDSRAWSGKALILTKLNKTDEALDAYKAMSLS